MDNHLLGSPPHGAPGGYGSRPMDTPSTEPTPDAPTVLEDIESLQPHPDNPNRGNVDLIVESIITNGFYGGPIVQTSRRRILSGEHRWRALRQLQRDGASLDGRKLTYDQLRDHVTLPPLGKIPVQWFDCDDATGRRVLLIDNESAKRSTYDEPQLTQILAELAADGGSLLGTGFSDRDLADLQAKLTPPDLEDLARDLGAPSPSEFWPVIRLKVSPDTKSAYEETVKRLAGSDAGDDDGLRAVLRAAAGQS